MIWPRQPVLVLGMSSWAGGCLAWWAAGFGHSIGLLVILAVAAIPALVVQRSRVVALLVVVGLAAGVGAAWSHLATSRPDGLRESAAEQQPVRAVARVVATSVREPAEIGGRSTVRVVATLVGLEREGQWSAIRAPVTLSGAAADLGAPERGALLAVAGRLLPERPMREPGIGIAVEDARQIEPPTGWAGLVARTRADMWLAMAGIDTDAASLIAGLAIGDDSRQREGLASAMRTSGLSHLTAVSGGNIAIVAGLVVGGAALVGAPLRGRVAVGVAAVAAYAAFVGPEPSVLRAGVMGSVALVGLLRGGRGGGFPLLGLAVFVLVVARPGLILSWGFALSVAATAGILALAPAIERRLTIGSAGRVIAAAAAVTLGAQVATAPLLVAMTGGLPLISVPANLAAAPLVAPITVLGLAITLVSGISPTVGAVLAAVAEPFGALLARIARWAAAQHWSMVELPSGVAGAALVCGGIGGLAVGWRWLGPRFAVAGAAGAVLAVLVLGRPPPIPADWLAAACDVGQGDAFVIRAEAGSAVLIDTGPDDERLQSCLRRLGVDEVPVLVLTHFDTDHVAATGAVLERYRPREVIVSPVAVPAENAEAVQEVAQRSGTAVRTARPGQRFALGGAEVTVVWPRRIIQSGSVGNNAAVATEVRTAGLQLLFTGDLEPLGQAGLMGAAPAGAFDVTTIPHHGSANQNPGFMAWTGARLAWVSAGEGNRFGHPRPEALEMAAAAGMAVGRTDRDGTLLLVVREGRPQLVPLGPA